MTGISDRAKAHLALTKSAIRKPVNKQVGAIKAQEDTPYLDAKMYNTLPIPSQESDGSILLLEVRPTAEMLMFNMRGSNRDIQFEGFLQKGLNVRMLDGVHSSATEAEEDNSVEETVLVWMVGLNWLKARRMGATIHVYLPGRGDPFYQEMRKVLEVNRGAITDQLPKMSKDAWTGDYYAKGGLKSMRAHVPEKKKGKAIPFVAHGSISKECSTMVDYSRGNRDLPCLGIDEE
ncbi:hypothetical protein C8J56DRAFT_897994 [Mycena floridula]|nr:hypothetical protein C8J56DRAFT_897994 [Mycena floridula]